MMCLVEKTITLLITIVLLKIETLDFHLVYPDDPDYFCEKNEYFKC